MLLVISDERNQIYVSIECIYEMSDHCIDVYYLSFAGCSMVSF